jgi:hypothetical protein
MDEARRRGDVTDPALLAQLNAPSRDSGYVTDPKLLAQLNTPEGQRPAKEAEGLADALSEVAELYDKDGALVWLTEEGKLVRVIPNVLAEIIPKYLATKHLENHGDRVVAKYVPLVLDAQNLRHFFTADKRMGSLIARVTKV